MGAWIEIAVFLASEKYSPAAPFMGAWIEISDKETKANILVVAAPFMGAWIEIYPFIPVPTIPSAAPFMGAWIEMLMTTIKTLENEKPHPSWVRGLKLRKRC